MFILRVARALEEYSVRYAIAGGYAVALHGAVRGTIDIDLLIDYTEKSYRATESALAVIGLTPRQPVTAKEVFDFRDEYVKNRNMLAWSFVNPTNPTELVDILIAHDLKNYARTSVSIQGKKLFLLSLNDLISMKKKAGRPQDLADVESLKKLK